MGLGLFLISTLGGYWFLTHLHFTRYDALRDSGYHVFFRATVSGGILAAIAHLVVLPLNYFLPWIDLAWKSYDSIPYSSTAIFLSAFLGIALPFAGNRFYNEEKAARRAAERDGDLIELLVAESIEDQKLVEIALNSRKVYIGFALKSGIGSQGAPCPAGAGTVSVLAGLSPRTVKSGIGSQGEGDIELVPMAGGFRDKDKQELEITTTYAPVIWKSLEGSSGLAYEDFRVVIPMTEIISARIFLPEAYQPVAKVVTAFDRPCIPADCVATRSHTPGMLPHRALSGGRRNGLGARATFTTD